MTDEDMRARWDAAVAAQLAGHEAGCTFGGLSPSGGYWLAVEGCPEGHGNVCEFCRAEPSTSSFGGWAGGGIYRVSACDGCTQRWMNLNPDTWGKLTRV